MSDRFTRDPRRSSERQDDDELALRVREEMRTAVRNVRAGVSAGAHGVGDTPEGADQSADRQPGDRT